MHEFEIKIKYFLDDDGLTQKTTVANYQVYLVFHFSRSNSDWLLCHSGDLHSGLLDPLSDFSGAVDSLEFHVESAVYLSVGGKRSCGYGEGVRLLSGVYTPFHVPRESGGRPGR